MFLPLRLPTDNGPWDSNIHMLKKAEKRNSKKGDYLQVADTEKGQVPDRPIPSQPVPRAQTL